MEFTGQATRGFATGGLPAEGNLGGLATRPGNSLWAFRLQPFDSPAAVAVEIGTDAPWVHDPDDAAIDPENLPVEAEHRPVGMRNMDAAGANNDVRKAIGALYTGQLYAEGFAGELTDRSLRSGSCYS